MPAIERASGAARRARSSSEAAARKRAQQVDLDRVHRVDVGVAQAHGALEGGMAVEQRPLVDRREHRRDRGSCSAAISDQMRSRSSLSGTSSR